MKNLALLLEKEQNLLTQISENRKSSQKLLSNNRQLRDDLAKIRKEIVDYVVAQMEEGHKSLYQVVKDALGKIDSRYNKIYDLINKENLEGE